MDDDGLPLMRVKTSSDVYVYLAYFAIAITGFGLVVYWYISSNYAFIAALFITISFRVFLNGTESNEDPPPPPVPKRTTSKKKKKAM